jgi:hypothetical protein
MQPDDRGCYSMVTIEPTPANRVDTPAAEWAPTVAHARPVAR